MSRVARFILGFILFASCKEQNSRQELSQQKADSTRSFTVIEKDSAYPVNYHFNKEALPTGDVVFSYSSDKDHFGLLCDTIKKTYRGIFKKDTTMLVQEAEKVYTVNEQVFRVVKLVRDKGVTDGEVSYFWDTNRGLLISKSNTWRIAFIFNPEKDDKDYIALTALLYEVMTDEEIFRNPVPDSPIQFTTPKVE